LENLLSIKVDLVPRGAIKPRMWEYVKEDLVYV
jgi:predicted nucleotidyltransferase